MISLILAAALLAGEPATAPAAGAPAEAAAPGGKTETPRKPAMVCRKEPVLGSRLPTRTCMTQEAWDQRKTDSRDELEKAQRNQPYEGH